ncbi:ComEC/Rec2 family competence protein [Candidatus Vampirococcus lugosii]|uniref:Competence protein ComEC n=1 Tax=Candidatus Vampirococcus lugosii TaxID=2789015 RepID=A0ABS5QLE7_9BACT|nr:ComEC/Rec2 family competence protein [Candidatus Vampirococcus lugosii]MBS8122021.1 competence protein ComEC [Candidatus Vampirococcus lugosii]
MYILFFSINILLLVLIEDLFLFSIISLIELFIISILQIFYKEKLFLFFSNILLVILFPFLSIFINHYFYFQKIPDFDKSFVGTGQIVDRIDSQRFIFKDYHNRKYIYYSDYEHNIGDTIKTYSSYSPGLTQSKILNDFDNFFEDFYINLSTKDFEYEFDYKYWLFLKKYYGTIYEDNFIYLDNNNLDYLFWSKNFVKSSLQENLGNNKYSGLSIGVLIGDRSLIPNFEYQTFLETGLVHMIATSGTHIAFLVFFLNILFFWLPLYIRIIIIIFCVSFYSFMVGLSANIFRAWIMGSITLFAILAGREVYIWNLIKTAFVIVLLFNPYSILYDMGFALSFSALIGIIVFQYFLPKQKSFVHKRIGEYVYPTIGASLGVFPFLLFFTDQINLFTIFANILVVPFLPLLMIISLSLIFFDFSYLIYLQNIIVDWFYCISNLFYMNGFYMIIQNYILKIKLILLFISLLFVLRYFRIIT